jgi:hypothetical protein
MWRGVIFRFLPLSSLFFFVSLALPHAGAGRNKYRKIIHWGCKWMRFRMKDCGQRFTGVMKTVPDTLL